jgi:excisionase family DNA binding protein
VEVFMEEYARSALLLTVKDVMRELNLGSSKVEALMKHEGLPVIRFGRAVRVLADELKQWVREYRRNSLLNSNSRWGCLVSKVAYLRR